jgi:polysaccharide biosynthesis/export protein
MTPSSGKRMRANVRSVSRINAVGCLLACGLMAAIAAQLSAQSTVQSTVQSAQPSPGAVPGVAPVPATTSSTTPLPSPSMLYPGEDFLLAPGDLISVHVFLQADYQPTVRIGLDGTAELPFIGTVPLQGLTIRQAQATIAERLRAGGFYRSPEVTIQVLDSLNGSVTIAGEIKAVLPITGARRLIDVLSAAGGLPVSASHTIHIVRPGPDGRIQAIEVNLGADITHSPDAAILVYPRDIIQISRAGVVYVLGAFKAQGVVPLDQASPLTLLQLAALSGGIGYEGKFDDLRLIRTVGTERKLVEVDIKKVRDGKAPDPVLQANDIVFLPTDSMKAALKSLGVGGVLGLVSLLYTLHSF